MTAAKVTTEEFAGVYSGQEDRLITISEAHKLVKEQRGILTLTRFKITDDIRTALEYFDHDEPEWVGDSGRLGFLESKLENLIADQNEGEEIEITVTNEGYIDKSDIYAYTGYAEYGFFHINDVEVEGVKKWRRLNVYFNKSTIADIDTLLYSYREEYAKQNTIMDMFKEIRLKCLNCNPNSIEYDEDQLTYTLT